jgi:hypothetical protein
MNGKAGIYGYYNLVAGLGYELISFVKLTIALSMRHQD